MLFICYPKCSTCIKAKKYLDSKNIIFSIRDIKLNNPTYEEINSWVNKFNLNVNKLFNMSGIIYKELNLKDKLISMSDDEKIKLLSSNGMLIKRPLLIDDNFILIGFKESEWDKWIK